MRAEIQSQQAVQIIRHGSEVEPMTSRSTMVVLPLDWAQAVTRLQQMRNDGRVLFRLLEDERGRVRVEPE